MAKTAEGVNIVYLDYAKRWLVTEIAELDRSIDSMQDGSIKQMLIDRKRELEKDLSDIEKLTSDF